MKLEPELIATLKILDKYFLKKGINYTLIGAQVPRILINFPVMSEHRPTQDIDITLRSNSWKDFEIIKQELFDLGFKEDRFELRFIFQDTVLDIVPYLNSEVKNGILTLPGSGNTLNVIGFDRLLENSIKIEIQPDLHIPVVPLHILLFTKILAFLDRGINRNITKDIEDILFIFQNYESLEMSERRFDITIPLEMNYEDRGAFLLGTDLKQYLQKEEQGFVVSFLEHFKDEFSTVIQKISKYNSGKSKEIFHMFNAFRNGFGS
ncbi:MAG: nucleotidyl transferase AbiEii/AbiGii toxin family protein [Candidatus Cloacimonetes bacterium]|nr:nucleotidyl transferase AbiEii/AbiGii toxin family protein [Candidatus Cloacimonadota bacterium]